MKTIYFVFMILMICIVSIRTFLLPKNTKEKCMIVKGKGKNFVGDTIYVHKDFIPILKKIDNIAKQCDIKLAIRGSYQPLSDLDKITKFTTGNVGRHLKFHIMDRTGKKLICNKTCLEKEGERVPEVKCLVTGLRKENLRYAPHSEFGSFDDASDSKPGFNDIARNIQTTCKGAKF